MCIRLFELQDLDIASEFVVAECGFRNGREHCVIAMDVVAKIALYVCRESIFQHAIHQYQHHFPIYM